MQENKENKVLKFGYEELNNDLELDIFGIRFNIGIDENYLNKLKNFQNEVGKYGEDDYKLIEDFINELLGEGSYKKISEKYKKDLGKDIDAFVWVKVVLFIKNEMDKYFKNYGDELRVQNRASRRNNKYNRNYSYNGHYNSRNYNMRKRYR